MPILGQKRGPVDKLPHHTTAPKLIVFEKKGEIAKLPSEGTPREQAAKEEAKEQATKKEEAREPKRLVEESQDIARELANLAKGNQATKEQAAKEKVASL